MQWLSPGRYVRHFEVGTGSGRYADFAIMLPDENGQTLYLPVDSSFPADEFAGDWNDDVRHRLSESVNAYARRIASELIKPGLTADFAIMLIQNELVCARVNELDDSMRDAQLARRVIPAGPSAFWAMVRALEGGMNALAMQRRSEELERLLPVLERLNGRLSIPISIDTYYPEVAEAALNRGAAIINDVSGSLENGMPGVAARYGAGLVMMHAGGGADDRAEVDAVAVVHSYFQKALEAAEQASLPMSCVCLDPGIGFGKSGRGDLELIARLAEVTAGLPPTTLLVGASRKRVVGACCGNPPPEERLAGTLAIHTAAQLHGARILRVHNVKAAVQAARVTDALVKATCRP